MPFNNLDKGAAKAIFGLLKGAGKLSQDNSETLNTIGDVTNAVMTNQVTSQVPGLNLALGAKRVGNEVFEMFKEEAANKVAKKKLGEQAQEALDAVGIEKFTTDIVAPAKAARERTEALGGQSVGGTAGLESTLSPPQPGEAVNQAAGAVRDQTLAPPQPTGINEGQTLSELLTGVTFKQAGAFDFGGQLIKNPDGTITITTPGVMARTTGQAQSSMEILKSITKLTGQEPLQAGEREKQQLVNAGSIGAKLLQLQVDADKEGRLKPQALLTSYDAATKTFRIVTDGQQRIEALAAKDTTQFTATDDMAMIFGFMKIMDPTSVVREGEYATAQNAAGISDKVRRLYRGAIDGEKLSNRQRRNFINTSRKVFKGQELQMKGTVRGFNNLALKNDLDPTKIFRDVGIEQAGNQQTLAGTRQLTQSQIMKEKGAVGFDPDKGYFVDAQGNEVQ